jgi:hypothetical protein
MADVMQIVGRNSISSNRRTSGGVARLTDKNHKSAAQNEHQKITIVVDALDANNISNIGSKTIVEDKNNINIELTDNTKVLIIGDSNLRKMDAKLFNSDCHIICIPGANLDLINNIMQELPVALTLTDIIITAGICDSNNTQAPIDKCLAAVNRLKVRKHFLGLSWNTRILSRQQSKNLSRINNFAESDESTNYIKPPINLYFAEDGIHLQMKSVKLITDKILQHMERFLCQNSLRIGKLN